MARQTVVQINDDLGGAGEASPLHFSVEGERFVIDLNKRNRETFLRRMAPYMKAATPLPPGPEGMPKRYRKNPEAALIRDWAREHGYSIAEHGRLPGEVVNAYRNRNA